MPKSERAINLAPRSERENGVGLGMLVLTGCCILALSVVFNEYGMLHFEWWHHYINYHLGPGTIWKKIFDNRMLEQGLYSGRELSYLIDQFDMQVLAESVRRGFPLFTSTTHLLLSVAMGVAIGRFVARDLRLGSLIGLLLALLFWTTPFIYLHFLMRTAKGLTAAGAVMLVIVAYRACMLGETQRDAPLRWRHALGLAVAGVVMSFADRQGFYLLLCAVGFAGLEWGVSRRRVARDILLVLIAVLGVELLYFFKLAPTLTKAFWGYDSDFSFNRLPWNELWAQPAEFAARGMHALLQTIAFTLGGVPRWVAGGVVAVVLGWAVVRDVRARAWREHVPGSVFLLIMLGGLWVMFALMILRHPPLVWPDIQTNYYWMPAMALVVLGLSFQLRNWIGISHRAKNLFAAMLLVLVMGNIAALPGHRRTFTGGHLAYSVEVSQIMRASFMNRGDPELEIPVEVQRLPVYPFLLAYAPERNHPPVPWDEFGRGEFFRRTHRPGGPVEFFWDFGGNIDARFLTTTGRLFATEAGANFIGASAGHAEMRFNRPSNRLRGEVIVQRTSAGKADPVAADFVIYAQPYVGKEPRFERWRGRVVLPAGQRTATASYEIDSGGLPTLFTLEITPEFAGRLVAGWRMPTVTDIGRDTARPAWFSYVSGAAIPLGEPALARLLPDGWRPAQAWMMKGRVVENGIELSPGGEIWLKAEHLITSFSGMGTTPVAAEKNSMTIPQGAWYKAGRLHVYGPPVPLDPQTGARTFQATGAEPGGWLVITTIPDPTMTPVIVRVVAINEVK